MTVGASTSWPRWAARLRVAVVLGGVAALWVAGVRHTRLWVGSFYARAHGPFATFDEVLAPLGVPSAAATITRVLGELPADRAVAFVGEGADFPFVLAAVNVLSYPRPFTAWECVHPAAPARYYYGWPTTRPNGVVFVYRPQGLAQRHAVRWLSPKLLALRRPERFPPPRQLCESVPEPGSVDRLVTRADAALELSGLAHRDGTQPRPAVGVFEDVGGDGRRAAAIEELYRRGIVAGCGARRFCPDDDIRRADLASLVVAIAGQRATLPEPRGIFADVPPGDAAARAVEAASALGLPPCRQQPLRFCPDDPVTQREMDALLAALGGSTRTRAGR
jgi:hypothetical protein